MKIVIINGSARDGNTAAAVRAFAGGAQGSHEVEIIRPDTLNIAFCKGCGACECVNGCVDNDDTNPTIDRLVAADLIVFATPVYWWGVSAQLKLIMDKCYCRGGLLKGKKVGLIVPGGSPVDAKQYALIKGQFDCIADYLKWKILFFKPYYATEPDELSGNPAVMKDLEELGRSVLG